MGKFVALSVCYMRVLLLVFLALVGWPGRVSAQYFRHYTVEQGLSNNIVFCSLQDERGFMWFGTRDGLNRFDGYTFHVFRHVAGDSTTLGSNYISCLYEDAGGRLWVGTGNGLYQYRPFTEDFVALPAAAGADVKDVLVDAAGRIWYIANLTLHCYEMGRGVIQRFDGFSATSLCLYDQQVWAATNNGSLMQVGHQGELVHHAELPVDGHAPKWIEKIYPLSSGGILVGTAHYGPWVFQPSTHTVRQLSPDLAGLYVRDFLEVEPDDYWIATESGIFRHHPFSGYMQHIRKQVDDPYTLSDNAIYTLWKDREGGVWAGSYFGGINYWAGKNELFHKIYPRSGANGISGTAVREIVADDEGNHWIGTEDAGLNKLDVRTGTFSSMPSGEGPGMLSSSNIHGLLPVGDHIWVGTFEQGLNILDRHTKRVVKHYRASDLPGALRSDFIITLLRTRAGTILVGTGLGLFEYQERTDSFLPVAEVTQHDFIYSLYEDSRGTIWAGTLRNGVYHYNRQLGTQGQYQAREDDSLGLGSNTVTGIFEDSNQQLWFTTEGGGFSKLQANGTFRRYTTANGLPSNISYRMLEDAQGLLWVSTSKGLVAFHPVNESFSVYTQANGLTTDQFNYNSGLRMPDGRLCFGSVKGMVQFDPAQLHTNTTEPTVYITGFQVHNEEVEIAAGSPLSTAISFTDHIQLAHNQSTFSIDFAALSYVSPETNAYAYRMEGLEDDWTYLRGTRKVYYTDLKPGSYRFLVKGANSDGVWATAPTALAIRVSPPFYASPLAYLGYLLAVACLGVYLIRHYHRRTRLAHEQRINQLEREKAREISQAKIDFFTNMTHEIRTPLTLIKAPLDNLLQQQQNPQTAEALKLMQKNTGYLIALSNQLLDFRKHASPEEGLYFTKTDIKQLLEDTIQRYQPLISKHKLVCTVRLPELPLYAFVDTAAFQKISSNLLDNAIKYSGGHIHIDLESLSDKRKFLVRMANDGPNVPPADREKIFEPFYRRRLTEGKAGTGLGLPLARSLAQLHKGTLTCTVSPRGWNEFTLVVPVHQDQEFEIAVAAESATVVRPPTTQHGKKHAERTVLIVEDHPDILQLLVSAFEPHAQVQTATNGREAMEVIHRMEISLIVSDVMMPVMDGFALCRAVKSDVQVSHIPVMLLTAKTALPSKVEGLGYGADVYIEKPFSVDHVLAQADSLLANRKRVIDYIRSVPLASVQQIAVGEVDKAFLDKLNQLILDNIANPALDVGLLAAELNMSKPTLFRKIKGLSDFRPNELITLVRLKKAAELLAQQELKVYEVCELVGYNSQSYFTRSFQKQFGMSPTEYVQKAQQRQA